MFDDDTPNHSHQDPELWLSQVTTQDSSLDLGALKLACDYARSLSATTASPYKTSTLEQGLNMASLLAELNCDTTTLAAAIAYPAVYYSQPQKEKVRETLGPSVAKLIYGAIRMEAIHEMHRGSEKLNIQQIDQLRKMLLAIVDDIRVVLIKLTERLMTLQYLKKCTPEQQQYIAKQVIDFYAPLANRLGIWQLKWQLEDLAFRFLYPEQYFSLSKALNMRRTEREAFIETMISRLKQFLDDANIKDYQLSGRAKHIYSLHKKLEHKQKTIADIYDISALRILVNSINDCYTALSIVHDQWSHVEKEFDDYIARPKSNGYQSIHTVILTEENRPVEIQIRTYDIHASAELGIAAHWKYKEADKTPQENYEEKIARLRELMNWQQEMSDHTHSDLYQSLFSDRIYVFTPQGDVFNLPARSTPLDFAYHIHTAIGHRAKGAKVNDKMVPLIYTLQTGDRVEIITGKDEHPSRDWMNPTLGYLTTSSALQKVRHFYHKQNYERHLAAGLEIWEKATRHESLTKNKLAQATQHFNVKKIDDLLASIGSGYLAVTTVIHYLKSLSDQKEEINTTPDIKIKTYSSPAPSELIVDGVGHLLTHLAKCCKPIPGDEIIGFITHGRGISIHHIKCKNIQHEMVTRPQRMIEVTWGMKSTEGKYPIDLFMIADDRTGLVRDISAIIANEKLHFLGLNSNVNKTTNQVKIYITIELPSTSSLEDIRRKILSVPGVLKVERV